MNFVHVKNLLKSLGRLQVVHGEAYKARDLVGLATRQGIRQVLSVCERLVLEKALDILIVFRYSGQTNNVTVLDRFTAGGSLRELAMICIVLCQGKACLQEGSK